MMHVGASGDVQYIGGDTMSTAGDIMSHIKLSTV